MTLYRAHSTVEEFRDHQDVRFAWFCWHREDPAVSYPEALADYGSLTDELGRRLAERVVDELLTATEVEELRSYLGRFHEGCTLEVEEVELPFVGGGLMPLGAIPRRDTHDFYHLWCEPDFDASVAISAFYDLVDDLVGCVIVPRGAGEDDPFAGTDDAPPEGLRQALQRIDLGTDEPDPTDPFGDQPDTPAEDGLAGLKVECRLCGDQAQGEAILPWLKTHGQAHAENGELGPSMLQRLTGDPDPTGGALPIRLLVDPQASGMADTPN